MIFSWELSPAVAFTLGKMTLPAVVLLAGATDRLGTFKIFCFFINIFIDYLAII